jgi:peptidoglycan/LPS O-acetylase OafA/YrhL
MAAERNQSLDVLRCVAVLLVLGVHVPHYRAWANIGWVGVDLFFVLSGFLISGLLFRDYQGRGAIDWKRFLIRRGFKIYPSYYMFLWIAAILLVSVDHRQNMRTMLLGNAVFVGNYFQRTVTIGPFVHLWSIAVEEHFYVLLPVLLVFLSKRKTRDPFAAIPWLFGAIAGICLALRVLTLPDDQFAYMSHLRMDSLFDGVTLGYVYHFRSKWFARLASPWTLVAAGTLCLPVLIAKPNSHMVRTVGLTSICLGFALLLAWSVDRRPKSTVGKGTAKFLATIGFYSYSIYLWHALLALIFVKLQASTFYFWLYIGLSVAIGILMSKVIEMPALVLRERLFPASPPQIQAAPPEPHITVMAL